MKTSKKQLDEQIRQVGFVIILVVLICTVVYELKYFVSAVLGSFTLYLLLRRPHRKLVARGWKNWMATTLLMVATVIVLGGFFYGVASIVLPKARNFNTQSLVDAAKSIHLFILDQTGFDIFSAESADKILQSFGKFLPDLFTTTSGILINAFMTFVLLCFMLQANSKMEEPIMRNFPLGDRSATLIRHEVHNIVVSNAIGIPVIIAGHAIMAGLGYWILGAGDPVVWGLITGLCGLVPVVGSAAVWVPMSINLFVQGDIWQSIVLLAYGALIVANTDNVIRMILMKRYADVHPLITIFGVILGLNLFGFWGIIFGPLLLSGILLMVKIYRIEFLGQAEEPRTPPDGDQ